MKSCYHFATILESCRIDQILAVMKMEEYVI